ncbi:hypothetical protein GCM10011487_24950 [Steroidobacter agaridevorans]|uniref:Cytochrome c domain-containing protein n=1 Tax=Steroidobacter agaridevorans TaxID=2695856 RepID=A0A829YBI1_9GAMM|nr:hypothetical protein [Steroidobacter agaridevorans]GFE80495.1 hypothetical protein GCM10011487_24950 [Steroidobacter agaridevorans]
MRKAKLLALCTSCALAACAGDGSGLDENGRPEGESSGTLQPNFQSIQDNVFTPVCTGCHAGAAAPLGLRLDEGASYALLVNAPSVEVPSLQRVQPSNPDASYLIQKLEGTAAVGARMPLNQPALPAETIAVIRQWITDGASNNTGTGAGGSGKSRFELVELTAVSPARDEIVPGPVRDVVVTSNVELDATLLQSSVIELRASGGDGTFDSGNERAVPVDATVRSDRPSVLAITPRLAPLSADSYELRISGTDPVAMADLQARPIDGDGDGAPGGDFVLRFTVEMTQ